MESRSKIKIPPRFEIEGYGEIEHRLAMGMRGEEEEEDKFPASHIILCLRCAVHFKKHSLLHNAALYFFLSQRR
jgi:hypothetical protein